jgi:hypothetical protein
MEVAARLCFVRSMYRLFHALHAATTTLLLRSQIVCSALVLPLEEKILARVTAEARSSAHPRYFLVWCLSVMAVPCPASLASTLTSALFHLLLPATFERSTLVAYARLLHRSVVKG